MDTISRENNSMLPVGAAIVGAIALIVGLYAAVSISKINTKLTAHQEKIDRIDDLAAQVSSVSAKTDKTDTNLNKLVADTQSAINQVAGMIGTVQASVKMLEESSKHAAPVKGAKGAKGGAVVAGPGEYVVKSGDTPHKIAAANGCTVSELMAVNPALDPKKLHIGQKLKLPEKQGAASAAPVPAPATP